jgi:hypothetical protein
MIEIVHYMPGIIQRQLAQHIFPLIDKIWEISEHQHTVLTAIRASKLSTQLSTRFTDFPAFPPLLETKRK